MSAFAAFVLSPTVRPSLNCRALQPTLPASAMGSNIHPDKIRHITVCRNEHVGRIPKLNSFAAAVVDDLRAACRHVANGKTPAHFPPSTPPQRRESARFGAGEGGRASAPTDKTGLSAARAQGGQVCLPQRISLASRGHALPERKLCSRERYLQEFAVRQILFQFRYLSHRTR